MGGLMFGGGLTSSILIGWPVTRGACNQNFVVCIHLVKPLVLFKHFYTCSESMFPEQNPRAELYSKTQHLLLVSFYRGER